MAVVPTPVSRVAGPLTLTIHKKLHMQPWTVYISLSLNINIILLQINTVTVILERARG